MRIMQKYQYTDNNNLIIITHTDSILHVILYYDSSNMLKNYSWQINTKDDMYEEDIDLLIDTGIQIVNRMACRNLLNS